MDYQITTKAGALIQFSTDLTIEEARAIVETLPSTGFREWITNNFGPKADTWALKEAQDHLNRQAPQPQRQQGEFLNLVQTMNRMQEGAAGHITLRFEGLKVKTVTRGPNAGSIYVHTGGGYAGKITPEGFFYGSDYTKARLAEINADPLKAAVSFGRANGICSCCGRGLVDPVSVFGGIGPICLGRLAGPDARAELEMDYREHQAAALLDAVLAA